MADRNKSSKDSDNEDEVPLDPLVYAQSLIAGLIHPQLSVEQKAANYKYLERFDIDFPGLEPIVEEVETSWREFQSLPTLPFLRTRHSQFEEFLVGACERLGQAGSLPSHQEYIRMVDRYVAAWEKRNLRSILAHAADLAGENTQAAMTYIEENVRDVHRGHTPISEIRFSQIYKEDISRSRIFPAHLRPLDQCIGNFRLGNTAILAAFRSHFKTTVALNICYNAVVRYGFHCCFLSLEMSKAELMTRLFIRHAQDPKFGDRCRGITLKRVQRGLLTPEEEQFLDEVDDDWKAVSQGKMEILASNDFPQLSMSEIYRKLHQVESQLGGHLHAVFVDYIQLLGRTESNEIKYARSVYDVISFWARRFQQLAKNFNKNGVFVMLLAQTSNEAYRGAEKAKGKYESGRIVGDSKEIEDAADYLITLFCGESEKSQKMMKVQVLKNRHGEALYVPEHLAIDPDRFLVHDWERSEDLNAYTIDVM